jgi:hypothetical protein
MIRLCGKHEGDTKMDWVQTLSIIITVIGSAYFIHRDIREDMKTQTARTDQLYQMFIDLRKEVDQKFYDLLREGRK